MNTMRQRVRLLFSSLTIFKVVIACNILLACYNFTCFNVSWKQTEPIIVILKNTESQNVTEMSHKSPTGDFIVSNEKANLSESTNRSRNFGGNLIGGQFVVMENYFKASGAAVQFSKSITYTTQATHEFLFPHVEELCDRWAGPISVSVYAPGKDFEIAIRKIAHLIQCSSCVAQNVTFHMVYHVKHVPTKIPTNSQTYLASTKVDCVKFPDDKTNYRKNMKLTYPINVLRNVARTNAKTRYVLASDIELYPSVNIIPKFINMVDKKPLSNGVYTLPIFEVDKDCEVPRTKSELRFLYSKHRSEFFHRNVCDVCQKFPRRDEWIEQEERKSSTLSIFTTTKRRKNLSSWEPIFIGTNDEPLYAEELTWEGKRDKMSQMFELCLLDYDFRILDDAFLCHAPGIKKLAKKELEWRSPFIRLNNAHYRKIEIDIMKRNVNGLDPSKCISINGSKNQSKNRS